jgi:hypothetical protein
MSQQNPTLDISADDDTAGHSHHIKRRPRDTDAGRGGADDDTVGHRVRGGTENADDDTEGHMRR